MRYINTEGVTLEMKLAGSKKKEEICGGGGGCWGIEFGGHLVRKRFKRTGREEYK